MPRFQLFRVRVLRPAQMVLPFDDAEPGALLLNVLANRPAVEVRRGHTWHVGNLEQIDGTGFYFALGRTTRSTVSHFDESTGNFVEEPFENAPYTHVVMDFRLQVCAIAAQARLSPTIPGIARQLARLFTDAIDGDRAISVQVDALKDPNEFLALLDRAHEVYRFSMDFVRPNPWDVERDFQAPLQRTLQEAAGTHGRATLEGGALNVEPLKRLARAAAASGDDAEAVMRMDAELKPIKRRLRENPVILTDEDAEDLERMKPSLLGRMREVYAGVRQYIGRGD